MTSGEPGFLTPSNLITLTRVPLGLAFLTTSEPFWLGVIVVVAALTDLADGFVARVTGTSSHIGLLLDPFCDKLFVLLALLSFLPGPHLDWAGLLILILRDIFTAGTYLLGRLLGKVIPFRPRWGGKIATALQLLTLLALILQPVYVPLLLILVGIASVYSIVDYGTYAIREEQRREDRQRVSAA